MQQCLAGSASLLGRRQATDRSRNCMFGQAKIILKEQAFCLAMHNNQESSPIGE